MLMQCAQAANTYIETLDRLTIADGNPLNVRQPTTVCGLLGVAYIVADLWPFSANITFHWHGKRPLSNIDRATKTANYDTTRTRFRQVLCCSKLYRFGDREYCQRIACGETDQRKAASAIRLSVSHPLTVSAVRGDSDTLSCQSCVVIEESGDG